MKPRRHVQGLMDEPSILVYPSLAEFLGINEAIIFQQIHFLVNLKEQDGNEYFFIDDRWWVYNTFPDWKKKYFRWLGVSTIKSIFAKFEKQELIISRRGVKDSWDQTKWYTIDYETWDSLCLSMSQNLANASSRNEPIDQPDSSHSYIETPTETPTENNTSPHGERGAFKSTTHVPSGLDAKGTAQKTPAGRPSMGGTGQPSVKPVDLLFDAVATFCFKVTTRAEINALGGRVAPIKAALLSYICEKQNGEKTSPLQWAELAETITKRMTPWYDLKGLDRPGHKDTFMPAWIEGEKVNFQTPQQQQADGWIDKTHRRVSGIVVNCTEDGTITGRTSSEELRRLNIS